MTNEELDELTKEAERIANWRNVTGNTSYVDFCECVHAALRAVHDAAIEKAAIVAEAHRIDRTAVTTGTIVQLIAESIRALKIGDLPSKPVGKIGILGGGRESGNLQAYLDRNELINKDFIAGAERIFSDLSDRSGSGLDSFDDEHKAEAKQEILNTLRAAHDAVIEKAAVNVKARGGRGIHPDCARIAEAEILALKIGDAK